MTPNTPTWNYATIGFTEGTSFLIISVFLISHIIDMCANPQDINNEVRENKLSKWFHNIKFIGPIIHTPVHFLFKIIKLYLSTVVNLVTATLVVLFLYYLMLGILRIGTKGKLDFSVRNLFDIIWSFATSGNHKQFFIVLICAQIGSALIYSLLVHNHMKRTQDIKVNDNVFMSITLVLTLFVITSYLAIPK